MNASVAAAKPVKREREFPRHKIPLKIVIDGQEYRAGDWSQNGVGVFALDRELDVGSVKRIEMIATLQGGVVKIGMNARVIWCNLQEQRCGMQFVEPGEKQLALLQEIAESYMRGELVTEGTTLSFLDANMSDNKSGAAGVAQNNLPQPSGWTSRIIGLLVFVIIGGLAAAFLVNIVYEKLFTFQASSANVHADIVTIVSPSDGFLKYENLTENVAINAKIGDVVPAVPVPGQAPATLTAPCECTVLIRDQQDGAFVRAGEPVLSMVKTNVKPTVSVRVSFGDLAKIAKGASLSLTYLDGVRIDGVKILSIPKVSEFSGNQVIVIVDAGRELSPAQVGQPVYAVFDTAPWH